MTAFDPETWTDDIPGVTGLREQYRIVGWVRRRAKLPDPEPVVDRAMFAGQTVYALCSRLGDIAAAPVIALAEDVIRMSDPK